ncbi:uncharacterized protein BX664DRAFT_292287 [Halteromyces radiatus]|uniref:uncharacterized protein n=1 Tax=Halteromyces radiatus TaxID=101107 RepID=UPI00221E6AAC|nr:uncharacterized protein BX664DRAFT_292287 [Halteromyces radiatus]KAI8097016.1 hypothetical protein BX664DRAFT_292287 [Halteromyces radiatus]
MSHLYQSEGFPHIVQSGRNTELQNLSSPNQNRSLASRHASNTLQLDSKDTEINKQTMMEHTGTTINSGTKRPPLEQDNVIVRNPKRKQPLKVVLKREVATNHTPCTSLPLLPQVIRPSSSTNYTRSIQNLPTTQQQQNGTISPPLQPRWNSQSSMLFLALKQHPDHAMPRINLIKTALALDKSISLERNLPLTFRGKTPKNSASAILTNNHGRHFESFRPPGSRSMHFRLTFKPANFPQAVATYQRWMKILVTHDWPLCFGKPTRSKLSFDNEQVLPTPRTSNSTTNTTVSTSSLDATLDHKSVEQHHATATTTTTTTTSSSSSSSERLRQRMMKKDESDKENQTQSSPLVTSEQSKNTETTIYDKTMEEQGICASILWTISGDDRADVDTPDIPTGWRDIVRVEHKSNRNKDDLCHSVYAKRRLPPNTPLGFYFGTPTTEDEFDVFKQVQGATRKYCVMYGHTVLDATDDQGNLFLDETQEDTKIYCPFHFMRQVKTPDDANILLLKGKIENQVICWTKREINENEELLIFLASE